MRFVSMLAGLFLGVVSAVAAQANDLPMPTGDVVLTVSGQITHTNVGETAQFDEQMLRNLDWQEIETYTSFTHGVQSFAGPTFVSLFEAVGAKGSMIKATALNDYFVTIPMDHMAEYNVLLAYEHDGAPMRVRERGPLWVVYPLSESEAEKQPFDTEMIWQLHQLEVLP